ncbi:hypothetical protein E2C01_038482 [Portunus trituberculatus]|uniref:Uncharacterized protein n=1 Tax=Portunus trituberculatus TaxID=210409 RepID=A0A5B7FEA0_PORTR|nr:hypothetical protein [Portunus trituberculatus]
MLTVSEIREAVGMKLAVEDNKRCDIAAVRKRLNTVMGFIRPCMECSSHYCYTQLKHFRDATLLYNEIHKARAPFLASQHLIPIPSRPAKQCRVILRQQLLHRSESHLTKFGAMMVN